MHFNVYLQTIDDDEGYVFVELNFAWREREEVWSYSRSEKQRND